VQPGRAADHSPPSSAAVVEEYCTSTHPLGHSGPVMGKLLLAIHAFRLFCYVIHGNGLRFFYVHLVEF